MNLFLVLVKRVYYFINLYILFLESFIIVIHFQEYMFEANVASARSLCLKVLWCLHEKKNNCLVDADHFSFINDHLPLFLLLTESLTRTHVHIAHTHIPAHDTVTNSYTCVPPPRKPVEVIRK